MSCYGLIAPKGPASCVPPHTPPLRSAWRGSYPFKKSPRSLRVVTRYARNAPKQGWLFFKTPSVALANTPFNMNIQDRVAALP